MLDGGLEGGKALFFVASASLGGMRQLAAGPLLNGWGKLDGGKMGADLGFEAADFDGGLGTLGAADFGAVIIEVVVAAARNLMLRGHHLVAGGAADEPRVGEFVALRLGAVGATEQFLHALEVGKRHGGWVLAGVELASVRDVAGVKRVGEHAVGGASGERTAATVFACGSAIPPVIVGGVDEVVDGALAGENGGKHLLYGGEVVGIGNDGLGVLVVAIADGRLVREPTIGNFGAIAALDVLRQTINIVL